MKLFSKRSVVLFAGVMVVCAFAVPSMASAATFGPVGGNDHVLTSTDLSFTTDPAPPSGSTCSVAQFTTVVTLTELHITSATFDNCTGTGQLVNCTATPVAQNLPWTVTPISSTNITIDRVHVRVLFDNKPGPPACGAPGGVSTLTGNLGPVDYSDTAHEANLVNATGLTSHFSLTGISSAATVTGTIRDDVSPFITLT